MEVFDFIVNIESSSLKTHWGLDPQWSNVQWWSQGSACILRAVSSSGDWHTDEIIILWHYGGRWRGEFRCRNWPGRGFEDHVGPGTVLPLGVLPSLRPAQPDVDSCALPALCRDSGAPQGLRFRNWEPKQTFPLSRCLHLVFCHSNETLTFKFGSLTSPLTRVVLTPLPCSLISQLTAILALHTWQYYRSV